MKNKFKKGVCVLLAATFIGVLPGCNKNKIKIEEEPSTLTDENNKNNDFNDVKSSKNTEFKFFLSNYEFLPSSDFNEDDVKKISEMLKLTNNEFLVESGFVSSYIKKVYKPFIDYYEKSEGRTLSAQELFEKIEKDDSDTLYYFKFSSGNCNYAIGINNTKTMVKANNKETSLNLSLSILKSESDYECGLTTDISLYDYSDYVNLIGLIKIDYTNFHNEKLNEYDICVNKDKEIEYFDPVGNSYEITQDEYNTVSKLLIDGFASDKKINELFNNELIKTYINKGNVHVKRK